VTAIPNNVYGTPYLADEIPSEVRTEWRDELRREGLLRGPQPVSVLARTGYGELTFRHAEAWLSGRVLVCANTSHAQTMFPSRTAETSCSARTIGGMCP
jgi:hypothetical protein